MGLPTSFPLRASDINAELGVPPNVPFSLTSPEVRLLANKPVGQIAFSDLLGASAGSPANTGITTNAEDPDNPDIWGVGIRNFSEPPSENFAPFGDSDNRDVVLAGTTYRLNALFINTRSTTFFMRLDSDGVPTPARTAFDTLVVNGARLGSSATLFASRPEAGHRYFQWFWGINGLSATQRANLRATNSWNWSIEV